MAFYQNYVVTTYSLTIRPDMVTCGSRLGAERLRRGGHNGQQAIVVTALLWLKPAILACARSSVG